MNQNSSLLGSVALGALGAVAIAFGAAALGNNDNPDDPVVSGPGDEQPVAPDIGGGLHKARMDLAERLGVDIEEVRLNEVRHAGWNGCLGVIVEGQACTEIFIAGTIAMFVVDDEVYRYHIGGDQFIATDFVDGEVEDGMPIQPELMPDTNAIVADYARADLGLRLGVDPDDIVVTGISPATFDLCLGFVEDLEQACNSAGVPGAIVFFEHVGETYRYHVSSRGMVAVSFEEGHTVVEPDEAVLDVQRAMREDLAKQLGVDPGEVSMASYREVTWPDGCVGVYYKDSLCTQALVEGFLANLTVAGDGTWYRYHGAGTEFIAVWALDPDEVRIGDPIAPGTDDGGLDDGDAASGDGGSGDEDRVADPKTAVTWDLAEQLGVDESTIEVVSYEEVGWDGCLGVYFHDTACTMNLVTGYIAILQVEGDDTEYRYHGQVGGRYIAVWSLDPDDYELGEPLPLEAR